MHDKTDRSRVKGFLRADGTRIANDVGEEILLAGGIKKGGIKKG